MTGRVLIDIIRRKEAEDMEIKLGVQGYEMEDDDYVCYGVFDGVLWLTDACHYPHEEV